MSWLLFSLAVVFYTKSQTILFKGDYTGSAKYRTPLEPPKDNWYYRFFRISHLERFPGSGSFLVSLTDSYHRFQLFFKLSIVGAVILYKPWLGGFDGVVYFVLWGVVFSVSYRLFR